ncbi:MAG: ADP-ribosylglycohydrolase family protein [Clostridium sp.]
MGNIVTSGVLGFVVGDALGLAYQDKSREEMKNIQVVMGKYENREKGSWSDDTSTMLCTMEGLTGGLDYNNIAKALHKWLKEGYLTPGGEAFSVGRTTNGALSMYKDGIDPTSLGLKDERSLGNGSLMRMLPLAYYLYAKNYDQEKTIEIIKNVSSITHGHSVAIVGCIIYTLFAMSLIEGNTMWNAYIDLKDKINTLRENNEYRDEIELYSRIIDNNIIMYDESEIKSTGYCVDTLEAVFWSFLNGDGYNDCVNKGIKLGCDTDTIGALTGALAGIYYGEEDIEVDLVENIILKDKIISVSDKFFDYLIESTN